MAVRYRPPADAFFRGEDPLAILQAIPGRRALTAELTRPPGRDEPYDTFRCQLDLRVLSVATEGEVRQALRLVSGDAEMVALAGEGRPAPPNAAASATVRVSGDQIDKVAALADDLVIAKNGLEHAIGEIARKAGLEIDLRDLSAKRAAMERAVSGLHGAIADLRLVSLRGLFARFPRHVRDVAAALGKPVDFSTSGDEVVLDKSVVEQLFEPLLHLVRNAIDHGLEAPEPRRVAGKPEIGRIRLSARAAGDVVRLELSDDGRGLDIDSVRAAAVARGLLTSADADKMDNRGAANLVFAPGFSTARDVGELSGRGVGLDAVRETAERLGGRVELESRPGRGLTVSLVLPSRTVLTRVLIVEAGGERFAVPLQSVMETHRLRADEVTSIRQGRAYLRRDTVIPLLRLGTLLELAAPIDAAMFPVLVVSLDGQPVGIQVEALGAQMEAPLRPLEGLLQGFPGVLGSILEGDGRVLLVLDLAELAA